MLLLGSAGSRMDAFLRRVMVRRTPWNKACTRSSIGFPTNFKTQIRADKRRARVQVSGHESQRVEVHKAGGRGVEKVVGKGQKIEVEAGAASHLCAGDASDDW
eukprot:1680155-Rhodomonas_salina.3